ncbi:MAG: CDP-diacylglycerol--glycerol-3-phosphate 3-phosphatidyltransferase [Clostridia bacterium]|nr:CDP-diacylglycerol--glycerol-3-phosphate 3-phosphatidyltransferase [Clostridia bacterium]
MNLPNKLTILRVILAPLFLILLVVDFPHNYIAALVVFVAASITDLLDGKIARKHNLITNFGKFMDPLADKMLVHAAFIGFLYRDIGWGMLWINFIMLTREFLVTSVRYMAATNGKVVAADIWGKLKTVMQMVAVIATIFFEWVISLGFVPDALATGIRILDDVLLWVSAILSVISGINYLVANKEFFAK